MHPIESGGWMARQVFGADLESLLAVRAQVFRGGAASDRDEQDADCAHISVTGPDGLQAGFRARVFADGSGLSDCYAQGFYDLTALSRDTRPVVEVGRVFVLSPDLGPATRALRLLWAAMTRIVTDAGAARLIGCTSFPGADPQPHASILASLAAHVGPVDLLPGRKAADIVPLAGAGQGAPPGLLRMYLALGAWVGDHAVIDRDLGTLHVFTCLDVDRVPLAMRRSLQAAGTRGRG